MSGIPLSTDRKAAFLAELARHGIVMRAARAASPHSPSGCQSSFQDERNRDPEFAAAWDNALTTARADIEHEIFRRAQEGYEEPVFGGKYKERVVGTIRRYSDRLLELRARAMLPEYREAAGLSVTKRISHTVEVPLLGQAVAAVAMQFAKSVRQPELTLIEGETSDAL